MLQILQAQDAELSLDTKGKEGIHPQVLQIHSECLSQINKDVHTGICFSVYISRKNGNDLNGLAKINHDK